MTVHKFLRSLSKTERTKLASEIDITDGYLRLLCSREERIASIEVAKRILASKVNKDLPEVLRFSEADYLTHRLLVNDKKQPKGAA